MLENLTNQLLAEKEEGIGKKFLEASETVLEALTCTWAAMAVSLHSPLGSQGSRSTELACLGQVCGLPHPYPAEKGLFQASRRSLCRDLSGSNVR